MSDKNWLKEKFKICASCSGNIFIPHLPCAGLMALASSSALAAAYVSNIWLVGVTSIVAAGGGYLSWRRSRKDKASKAEHASMITGSVLAAGLMIGMHLPGIGFLDHHHHHNDNHEYNKHEDDSSYLFPEDLQRAQLWYDALPVKEQNDIQKNAVEWSMQLEEAIYHAHTMCTGTASPAPLKVTL